MNAKLIEYRDIAPKVRHFVFEVPDAERWQFTPGQWVSLTDTVGGKPLTRAYSVCSAPDGNRFELCLNRVEEGAFSPHLFGLRLGDEVPLEGPMGAFTLRDPIGDSMLVATGTGIAPFRAMLRDPGTLASGRQFTLVLGARYEHSLLYRDEFEALEVAHPNFRFVPVLSRPEPSWRGRVGRVQPHAMDLLGDRRDIDVYICGLKEMVNQMRRLLQEAGFEKRRIVYEKYD